MKKIILLITILISQNSFSQSKSEIENFVFKTASLASTPKKVPWNTEVWQTVDKIFPKFKWTNIKDDQYTDAISATPFEDLTIYLKGANVGILDSTIEYTHKPQDLFLLWEVLIKNSKLIDQRCDLEENMLNLERFALVSFKNYKPVIVVFSTSSGNHFGIQKLQFTHTSILNLPEIGSKAENSTWSKKCDSPYNYIKR
jgi:hypothetical protein